MKNDYILSESEISIAVNKITNMADFLSSSMDTYISILSDIQTEGIKDKLICAELTGITYLVRSYQEAITSISSELSQIVQTGVSGTEENDKFSFPSDFMTEVTYLLSKFL